MKRGKSDLIEIKIADFGFRIQDEMALSPNSPPSFHNSPFGPLDQTSSRKLFGHLVATLNAAQPDYDFSSLIPSDFKREHLSTVTQKVNEVLDPQKLSWGIIDDNIQVKECEIFSLDQSSAEEANPNDDEEVIWSQTYFFLNRKLRRVLYLMIRGLMPEIANEGQNNSERSSMFGNATDEVDEGIIGDFEI